MDILRAVNELYGDCLEDEQGNIFVGDAPITEAQLVEATSKAEENEAVYDSQAYARSRAKAYPSLQDQADMQYHDAVDGTTTWQNAIKAVKDKYPKN